MAIFLNTDISQDSVATCRLRRGGIFKYDSITNLLLSLTMKMRKSANIWRSYGQEYDVSFFLTLSVGLDTFRVTVV